MSNILPISKREITRLRSRFKGRSRFFVIGIFAVAVMLSFVIYHQDPVISKSIYNIGVSLNGPAIVDERFNVIPIDLENGLGMLYEGDIDLYVHGDQVVSRNDITQCTLKGKLQKLPTVQLQLHTEHSHYVTMKKKSLNFISPKSSGFL